MKKWLHKRVDLSRRGHFTILIVSEIWPDKRLTLGRRVLISISILHVNRTFNIAANSTLFKWIHLIPQRLRSNWNLYNKNVITGLLYSFMISSLNNIMITTGIITIHVTETSTICSCRKLSYMWLKRQQYVLIGNYRCWMEYAVTLCCVDSVSLFWHFCNIYTNKAIFEHIIFQETNQLILY